MRPFSVLLLLVLLWHPASGQKPDTARQVAVTITNARFFESVQTDTGTLNKLIGDVALEQGGTLFYCDSAYLDLQKNNLEAFSGVRIVQPGGTQVTSDYLRYTGNQKLAYLHGDVHLVDGTDNLWTDELNYRVDTKLGTYTSSGTLQTATTTLTSDRGTYNARNKDSRFTGNVLVTNPDYNVVSDDLGYNTATELVRFFGPSVVTNDKSQLRTTSGTYDSKAQVARFTKRSSIWSGAQYAEGDTMDYDRHTGLGTAVGRVIAYDTLQQITLWSDRADVHERLKTLLATITPVLRKVNGADTLYMAADTFYSAPRWTLFSKKSKVESRKTDRDTVVKARGGRRNRRDAAAAVRAADSSRNVIPMGDTVAAAGADSAARALAKRPPAADPAASDSSRYFTGFHGVRVFSDSLQARCDSISYTQYDSTLRLMRDPVAWSRNAQVSGDTLLLQNDSGRLKSLYIPANAFVVSRSGPEKANLYDQVQGKTLRGFFKDNVLSHIIVWPAAESIYYPTDDSGAYLGVNQAASERMTVYFDEKRISRILLEQEPKQTMTPMTQADFNTMRLSRFRWREEERPKSVEELFR